MGKLKLLLISLLSMLTWNGAFAENIETDLTAQFPLDWQGWTGATGFVGWAAPTVTTNDGRSTAACEQYNEGTIAQTGVVFSRTLTGLANGNYTIELYGAAAFTPGRSCTSTLVEGDETAVYLYAETPAGTVKQYIPAHVADNFNTSGIATATLEGVEITDGTVTIGMYKDKGLTNWHVVQIKGVTAIVDKDALIANRYAPLDEALAKGEAVKANIVGQDDAISTYNKAVEPYVQANANRTLEYDVAAAVAAVNAAVKELSKYQTADGSDLSAFIVNAEVNGADGWTCERPKAGNGPTLNGTAFEYWAGNAEPRSEGSFDYYQVINGLTNGIYTVSAEMFNSLNGEEGAQFAPTAGLYAQGENEVVALVTVDSDQFTRYTTGEVTVTDGTLRIGVKNTEIPMAARWFAADNFQLTLVKAISDDEINYYKALSAIEDGKSYRVFAEVDQKRLYLNTQGSLVEDPLKAATFTFNAVKAAGTLYETGWNLGCKFTNPSLTGGSTGDVKQTGHINVGQDRNDWERQVFFLNAEGKYAVRATNANSANWGANTYWDVVTYNELPSAGYSLNASYVWQIEEFVDNRPAAFAKVQTWASKLQAVEGLAKNASQWISNAKESSEGSYEGLVDGDYGTYFHSSWSAAASEDHYIQAELPEAVQSFYFYFVKRDPVANKNVNNRPTDIVISGSNDGENFTQITQINEGLPVGTSPVDYASALINANEAYKYLRFTVLATNNNAAEGNGHKFFTFSEFYILPSDELTDEALPYLKAADYTDLAFDDVDPINAIDEKIAAAKAKVDLASDLETLNELAEKLQAQIAATETYNDPTECAANINGSVETIKNGNYTTEEEIANAKTQLLIAAHDFFGAIEPKTNIDVTEWFVVNPSPLAKKAVTDGWEGTPSNDATDGVAEYWNQAAASFHQTISLPAGEFKLTAVALQRTDMTGYVYAGNNQTTIVQVASSVANNRGQAASWFAGGNGLNEVPFTMTEEGNIEIGLVADEANGDHWTVWQSFKLELMPAPEETATVLPNIAALNEKLSSSDDVSGDYNLQLTNAKVLYSCSVTDEDYGGTMEYVILEDESGRVLSNITGISALQTGMTVNGQLPISIVSTYWSEAVANDNTAAGIESLEKVEGTVEPLVITEENALDWSEDPYLRYVEFQNAPASVDGESGDMSFTPSEIDAPMSILDMFRTGITLVDGESVNIRGFLYNYLGMMDVFLPVSCEAVANALELSLDVEREVGKGYDPTLFEPDLEAIKSYLGVEDVTSIQSYIVNADDTEVEATFGGGTPDGWCDAEGTLVGWGDQCKICVKFNLADGDYSICDLNGADVVDATYAVKYAFTANNKKVYYTINVKFVAAQAIDLEISNNVVKAEVSYGLDEPQYTEKSVVLTDDQVASICQELGLESLESASVYAYNPSTSELISNYVSFDGWRAANGDFAMHTGNSEVPACVKYTDGKTYLTYNIAGLEAQTIKTYWAIANETKAVLVEISFIYGDGDAPAEGETFEYTFDETVALQGETVYETSDVPATVTITPNGDAAVNVSFSGVVLYLPNGNPLPMNDFTLENVSVSGSQDASQSYSYEGEQTQFSLKSGMTMSYTPSLTGTRSSGETPELTLVLANPQGMVYTLHFAAPADEPQPTEGTSFDGVIKQTLSHPATGVQGESTDAQTVTVTNNGDGTASITYSGFTIPTLGTEFNEFTIEGVEVTENEDGSLSYATPEGGVSVVVPRGSGTVTYNATLEGTQANANTAPVLKLVIGSSSIDTVWFAADEEALEEAIETAIRGLNALGTSGDVFDLSGRKVSKLHRGGIYVVNGKKVSVK